MKKMPLAIALLALTPTLSFAETAAPEPASETIPSAPAVINCQYQLSQDAKSVDSKILTTWAKQALIQSFQFVPERINKELEALKSCYTEQGWQAFNDALATSGNLEAIRSNNLNVTSKIDGKIQFENIKEKQWKVSMPLKVTYQNKEKKLLQALNVDLRIALQKSGTLGIMQVIAVPQKS